MLHAGTLHLRDGMCNQLRDEWKVLTWNKTRDGHKDGMSDDCSDGTIYNANAHTLVTLKRNENPQPGTPEYLAQEAHRDKAFEAERARIMSSDMPQWKRNRMLRGLRESTLDS